MQGEGKRICAGKISSIDPSSYTARVVLPDMGEQVSKSLQIIRSGAQSYSMPTVGDEVVCGFLGSDPRTGFVLGSVYTSVPPVTDPNKHHIRFPDGSWVEYDCGIQIMTARVGGCTVSIAPNGVTIQGDMAIQGSVRIQGSLTVNGRAVMLQ